MFPSGEEGDLTSIEEFKYLGVLFMRIRVSNSGVNDYTGLSGQFADEAFFFMVLTEIIRSQVQMGKMRFLNRVAEFTFLDRLDPGPS